MPQKNKDRDETNGREIMANFNINDVSRHRTTNKNDGASAICVYTAYNDTKNIEDNRMSIGIASSNYSDYDTILPNEILIGGISPAPISMLNFYHQPFQWKNNPNNDGTGVGVRNMMTLSKDGILDVLAGITVNGSPVLCTKDPIEQFICPSDGYSAEIGNWFVESISNSNDVGFKFKLPSNFNALIKADVILIPDTTETIQWDVQANCVPVGEDSNYQEEELVNQTQAVTSGKITEVDVSGVLTNAGADKYCAIDFNSDTDYLKVVGLRLKYSVT